MVTEDRKALIQQEEIYREEVRKELLSQRSCTSRRSRFWKFLNSTFGIWFLSTCVIGAATFGFTEIINIQKVKRDKMAIIQKLDTEISARLRAFNLKKKKVITADMLLILEVPDKSDFPSNVFPEYKLRTFRSLIYELHGLVPDNEKQEIERVLGATENWNLTYYMLLNSSDKSTGFTGWRNRIISGLTVSALNLKRWEQSFSEHKTASFPKEVQQ